MKVQLWINKKPDFVDITPGVMFRAAKRSWEISSGWKVLDCVGVPEGLAFAPGKRAHRLIRTSQISPW